MKRTLALAGAALLVLAGALTATVAGPAQAQPITFPDVQQADAAYEAIQSLAGQGVMGALGDGLFRPDEPVTRADMVRILISWRNLPVSILDTDPAPRFPDVDPVDATYVGAAFSAGWTGGYPDGTFRPQTDLTREQMVAIVMRSLGLESMAADLSAYQMDRVLGSFSDQGSISPAARPYVALAVRKGLITGDGGRLAPLEGATRAELSMILARADGLPAEILSEALTPEEKALASFMDAYIFAPHDSPVTGAMVLQNADWYGVPPLVQLVIMAAETSLGDPDLGGALARNNNFGCLRYHGAGTPWGLLSSGRIWVAGKDWYSFPTAATGMAAFGRYLKTAVDGYFLPVLSADRPDWGRFASVYFGRTVRGYGAYVARLYLIERRLRAMAAEQGVSF